MVRHRFQSEIRVIVVALWLSTVIVQAAAEHGSEFLPADLLHRGKFGDTLPEQKSAIDELGTGLVRRPYPDVIWHIYYDRKNNVWLRLKIDGGADGYVSEILAAGIPLDNARSAPHVSLRMVDLCGIRIGDSYRKVSTKLGAPRRSDIVSLGSRKVRLYEFRGAGVESGTTRTFFCFGDRVVGFSISSPE